MRCADSVVERKCGLIRGRWVDPNIVSIDTNTGINTSISIVLVSNISIGINARMIGRIFFVYPLSSAYSSLNCVKNVLFFLNWKIYHKQAQLEMIKPFFDCPIYIIFIAYVTLNNRRWVKETGTFTLQVSKKPSFKMHLKLQSLFFCIN